MFRDPRTVPPGSTVEADICIIGAGPAGITLAREFGAESTRVCILESGGSDLKLDLTDLFAGQSVGLRSASIDSTRGWGFGGTSGTWDTEVGAGGPGWRSRPLDEWDLQARDWVPHSGWPFDFGDLTPYYRRAQQVCGLGPFPYEDEPLSRTSGLAEWNWFRPVVFQFGLSKLFWDTYRHQIGNAPNIDVYLGVVANGFDTTRTGDRVMRVRGEVLGGDTMYVAARLFVLATGGIENARLLLLSDDTRSGGLGNEHDLVGRFFMEHPHVRTGIVVPGRGEHGRLPIQTMREHGNLLTEVWLGPKSETLTERRLPNFALTFSPTPSTPGTRYFMFRRPLSPGRLSLRRLLAAAREGRFPERPVAELTSVLGDLRGVAAAVSARLRWRLDETVRVARSKSASVGEESVFGTDVMIEQLPNPDSRVVLTSGVNRLGVRRARLDWRLRAEDVQALPKIHGMIEQEITRLGIGKTYVVTDTDRYQLGKFNGGHHHMGTTRMHTDPAQGVVDLTCRVHSLSNLYVAGSSVFPTGGFANPTLTVVALALRLADHLKERVRDTD